MRRLDNIDIRLLRVFVALADSGGFADAQITLNLSQPTLSTHLAELEKRIGAQLPSRAQAVPPHRGRPGDLRSRAETVSRPRRFRPSHQRGQR
ncbi:helix-turn-helix domain-containing protein [Mesorhizobium sp.]|uniref:helix-turn-helix domain-containing protein n=1 Tax=Mesorhizobium sp. TaxID=1871066 RepID=UPI003BA8555E